MTKGTPFEMDSGMPRRRADQTKTLLDELTLAVAAVAVAVRRSNVPPLFSKETAETRLEIEGQSTGGRYREPRETLLLITGIKGTSNVFGYALGGKTPWMVDYELPRDQLEDLVAMASTGVLGAVDMTFERLRCHKGALLAIEFRSKPLPSERTWQGLQSAGGRAVKLMSRYPGRVRKRQHGS